LTAQPRSLVDLLDRNAEQQPDEVAYVYLADGERDERALTWGALARRARQLGGLLRARGLGGGQVLLVYPAGLDFLEAFYACLVAGAVAVPAELPEARRLARALPRLKALVDDSGAQAVLTTAAAAEGLSSLRVGDLEILATDQMRAAAPAPAPPVDPAQLAFLQYTSGSTARPRGAMLTHRSLVADVDLLSRPLRMRPGGAGSVFWVPLHHDMGLVGHVLLGLYVGRSGVFLSPEDFLARPMRWLEAISRHGARLSGCPNFAYEWCARIATPEDVAGLDLSGWELAVSGAEPIRPATLERFARTFAPAGFRREAQTACYGLAEVGVFVAGSRPEARPCVARFDARALEDGRAVPSADGRAIAGCGSSWGEQDLRIVDPATRREVAQGEVGEIWVRGPHVGEGYWNKPEETERTFGARLAGGDGPFLRTGDLAFLQGEEIFFTGRLKEALVLRGRTVAPHDVEATVERSPHVRRGAVAAFCVDLGDREELVVAAEVRDVPGAPFDPDALLSTLLEAIVDEHALPVRAIVLLEPGQLPRTTSGKTRRLACRVLFELQGWKERARRVVRRSGDAGPSPSVRDRVLRLAGGERRGLVVDALLAEVASLGGLDRGGLSEEIPLARYGVDSLGVVWLAHRVEQLFGVQLPTAELLARPTVAEIAEGVLAGLAASAGGPVEPAVSVVFEEGVV
jgi:acyl-CoA synthetase (AMP-forming)/AMP-acid ligase II/acyl carrier protein